MRLLQTFHANGIKLLLLLREPIQRAFSAYAMYAMRRQNAAMRERVWTYPSFEELISAEMAWIPTRQFPLWLRHRFKTGTFTHPNFGKQDGIWDALSCLQVGLYGDQLELMKEAGYSTSLHFAASRSHLLVLISERIRANASLAYSHIWNFLGVRPMLHPRKAALASSRVGEYGNLTLSKWAMRTLYTAYRNSTQRAFRLLGARVEEWEAWYATHQLQ